MNDWRLGSVAEKKIIYQANKSTGFYIFNYNQL